MVSLADQLWTVLVACCVCVVPGMPWIALLGARDALPPYLLAPAAAIATLAWTGALLIPALTLGLGIWWMLGGLVLVTLVGWHLAVHGMHLGSPRAGLVRRVVDASPAALVRGWHPLAWLAVLVGSLLAFVVGGGFVEGDPLYHASFARKLLDLAHPHFANTQMFVDGSSHPGYLIPAWHELVAVTSLVSGADVTTCMWIMPVVVMALSLLAIGGLGRVVFRSEAGALLAMAAFLASDVLVSAPSFDVIRNSMSPSSIADQAVAPAGIACWLIALHGESRAQRRTGLVLAALAVPVLIVTHSSYIVWYALGIAGYLAVWAVCARGDQVRFRRHLGAAIVVAICGAICMAAMLPALSSLNSFNGSGGHSALVTDYGDFRQLVVGPIGHFHLRADLLVSAGVLALVGMLCGAASACVTDEPGLWYVSGTTGLVGAVALIPVLFTHFAKAVSLSQAKRLALAVPHDLGLAFGLLVAGAAAARIWRRRRWGPWAAVPGVIACGALVAVHVHKYKPPPTLKRGLVVPTWPVEFATWALIVAFGIALIWRLVRLVRTRHWTAPSAPEHGRSSAETRFTLDRIGALAAIGLLLVAAAPTEAKASHALERIARHRPTSALHVGTLATVDPQLVNGLRHLPVGTVVLARQTFALRLVALAPIYITGAPNAQVARTTKNREDDRNHKVNTFYAPDSTTADRNAVLHSEHVQAVVVTTGNTGNGAYDFVSSDPRFQLVAKGPDQSLYVLRHA